MVLGDTVSIKVQSPQARLSLRLSLLGRFSEPYLGFFVIFGDTLPDTVQFPKVKLSFCFPLLGTCSVVCYDCRDEFVAGFFYSVLSILTHWSISTSGLN